ncbi:type III secretion protein [Yersinia pekkanenii]|uniref:Type III secretion system apparatus protein n=1 Tax=Yersinia pekkanenii TaxID=1288385 RepID=A0A0T9QT66_9GAMM|nr:type III secretion protein [Yersinia pekkanenii]CNI25245.1 type III secretion system apparatus protein [Yersinia pekkanenii]CRY68914.1 type III secretion system apparatus protein [Yersinia pekkanenii]
MNRPPWDILPRLLALRQGKERRLRQHLVFLKQEYQQREQQLANCHIERHQLCQQLQQLAQWRGQLIPVEADEQRVLQHEVYQAERRQQKLISELLALGQQQRAAIEGQQALLRRNQREQEKLGILIKDESNGY